MTQENHVVSVLHKNQREEFTLRHGVTLQLLDRECQILKERLDCRKAECGLCLIYVIEGAKNLNQPLFGEEQTLRAMRVASNCRLACQTRVFGELTMEIKE